MSLDKDKDFEQQLKQVQPVHVNELLLKRIEAAISESKVKEDKRRWADYTVWGGLVAAASIMIIAGLTLFNRLPDSALESPFKAADGIVQLDQIVDGDSVKQQSFEPVFAQNRLRERIDEGIVFLEGGLTARKYRYEFIDKVVWRNPNNGALVEMEVPRDEVFLVPVQTY